MSNGKPPIEVLIAEYIDRFKKMKGGAASKNPKLLPTIIILFIVFLFSINLFFVYVGPNQFGVKVKLVGMNAGVQKEPYQTGLKFVIPTINRMELFPKDIQVLELTLTPGQYKNLRNVKIGRPAHIQTNDGFYVDVDVSVLYRITDPYKVITKLGKKGIYEASILPKVEPALKSSLGKLTTEEFYNSPLRVEKTKQAKELLEVEFADNGLEVLHVLVRYFRYSDEIQKNIEEKKLKDQLVFKNQAEAKAATQHAILKKVIQEGEANMAVLREEGIAYVTKKTSEIELYSRKKNAEGDLLVKLAEAKKTQLRNDALKIGGSENLVGLEMAKVLSGIKTLVLSSDGDGGLNPLQLEKTLKTFDVR